MKRTLIIIAVVVAALLVVPAIAQASGWTTSWTPGAPDTPHRNYSQTSRKCNVCHAVHEAETSPAGNGEKLLRTAVANACDYCHVGGAFVGATQVYGSTSSYYSTDTSRAHNIGSGFFIVFDSNDAAGAADPTNDYRITGGLTCVDCHAVHGANTILAGVNILKSNPMPSHAGTATDETSFCADCHSNNWVTAKDLGGGSDQVSHYMGAVTSATLASTASTTCRSCHSGGNHTAANDFPHYTLGQHFLKDTYVPVETSTSVKIDGVCLDCHPNAGVQF